MEGIAEWAGDVVENNWSFFPQDEFDEGYECAVESDDESDDEDTLHYD